MGVGTGERLHGNSLSLQDNSAPMSITLCPISTFIHTQFPLR